MEDDIKNLKSFIKELQKVHRKLTEKHRELYGECLEGYLKDALDEALNQKECLEEQFKEAMRGYND